ncbi:uncharacterized protein LOC26526750 [Drosophila erecta]|uniref:BPTI/Kunitz inhibitor domain-containing protein n=1 Tax=Drosophila erecta TaxID=7220 RepID=A0A0Q5WLW5_DROER|nr:uncharacterized protein LOC26526750 [Drosophila erecta]KQS70250.1 uncharacterized protein Dere_GG26926 [Drosophila erecta]
MGNTASVLLFQALLAIVQSLKKEPGVNYCTMPVVLIRPRMMCEPLRSLWVLRKGKCVEALHCMDGYSKKECNSNCFGKKKIIYLKTNPPTKPKLITKKTAKPITTCATTEIEITTTTEYYEQSTGEFSPSTRETRRPKRTRRTRRFEIKEMC